MKKEIDVRINSNIHVYVFMYIFFNKGLKKSALLWPDLKEFINLFLLF